MAAMKNEKVRNAAGKPFSGWKPAEKFAYVMGREFPQLYGVCVKECLFASGRNWRFDFAWPAVKVAVEIDGFGFGHQAINRIGQNNEKRNDAVANGWRVLVFDSRFLGSQGRVQDAASMTAELICNARTKGYQHSLDDGGLICGEDGT